jgi:hypothetical protein
MNVNTIEAKKPVKRIRKTKKNQAVQIDSVLLDKVPDPISIDKVEESVTLDKVPDPISIDKVEESVTLDKVEDTITIDKVEESVTLDKVEDTITIDKVEESVTLDKVEESVILDKVTESKIETTNMELLKVNSTEMPVLYKFIYIRQADIKNYKPVLLTKTEQTQTEQPEQPELNMKLNSDTGIFVKEVTETNLNIPTKISTNSWFDNSTSVNMLLFTSGFITGCITLAAYFQKKKILNLL